MWKNLLVTAGALLLAVLAAECLYRLGLAPQNLLMLYILCVLTIARFTEGYFYGVSAAVLGTFAYDFLVTEPRMGFRFTPGLPITLIAMLAISLLACAVTTRMKNSLARQQAIRMDAEKEKMRGRLLRAISHDLRTPLAGILGAGSIMEERADTLPASEIRRLASDVRHNSEWLIRMVENLLTVTRVSGGAVKVRKTMEVAEEAMEQAASIVRKRFPDCRIHVSVAGGPLLVPMDATLITQVLINLLENAVKNSPAGVPVRLHVCGDSGFARFEMSDRGRGIPAQITDRLFQAQGQAADSVSGIGLSICKTIVDAHGGRITGDNRRDGGAVFNVMLPLNGGEEACP